MSTSRRPAWPGPSKKISSWVRPGVLEVRASALRPVSALMRLDLPTLERPAKAISTPAIGGSVSIDGEAQMNLKSSAKSLRPCSIRSASGSAVMRRVSLPSSRGARRRSDPGVVQGLDRFARNDALEAPPPASGFRFGLFGDEGRLQIIEKLHLHAVAAHDQALLQDRERVVPGPVDHQPRREACQHEREDQRHPAEDHLL